MYNFHHPIEVLIYGSSKQWYQVMNTKCEYCSSDVFYIMKAFLNALDYSLKKYIRIKCLTTFICKKLKYRPLIVILRTVN